MSDDDFEIRPGRIRNRNSGQSKERTLKAQLRALANRSGHGGRSGGSGSRRGTGRLARGRIASLRATTRASQRRVIVKARIVRHRGSRFTAAPLAQHLTYLKRDGVTRDGKLGRLVAERATNDWLQQVRRDREDADIGTLVSAGCHGLLDKTATQGVQVEVTGVQES